MDKNKEQYWDERSVTYGRLEWAKDRDTLKKIVSIAGITAQDVILDVGTGQGAVAAAVSPLLDKVVGVDISQGMLGRAEKRDNVYYVRWDIREPLFHAEAFTKVIARQVFHHFPAPELLSVVEICHDVLKRGGQLIAVEGVCPSEAIRDIYGRIFNLKDGRNVLTKGDLTALLSESGFVDIKVTEFIAPAFSVKNWLENNALSMDIQNRIFEMHVTAGSDFREAYNMKIINGDCLIDIKNVIVIGRKAGG